MRGGTGSPGALKAAKGGLPGQGEIGEPSLGVDSQVSLFVG